MGNSYFVPRVRFVNDKKVIFACLYTLLIILTSFYRDIVRGSQDVKWESIKGLENAKRLLKEAVVMPIKYPKYVLLLGTHLPVDQDIHLLKLFDASFMNHYECYHEECSA